MLLTEDSPVLTTTEPPRTTNARLAETYRANGAPTRILPSLYAGVFRRGKTYPPNGKRECERRMRQAERGTP